MEKKYKKLNWSKERKELFNRMSDWLEEIRKGEKTGFVWSMEQLLVFIEQEIDRAREETLNDFWTYFDEGKSELLELEDKGSMSLEEIEWDFGEERFKEYINKLTI